VASAVAAAAEYARTAGIERQAAIRAGYSAKTVYKIGSENLRKPQIAAAIAEAQAEYAKTDGNERWRYWSCSSARSSPTRARTFDDSGNILPPSAWPDEVASCARSTRLASCRRPRRA
jgi:phage terminase small subunit